MPGFHLPGTKQWTQELLEKSHLWPLQFNFQVWTVTHGANTSSNSSVTGSMGTEREVHDLQTKALKHQVAIHSCISVQECRFGTKMVGKQPYKKWGPSGWAEHMSAAYPHMKNVNTGQQDSHTGQGSDYCIHQAPVSRHLKYMTSFGLPKSRQQHSGARPAEGHQDCQRLDIQHMRRKSPEL